MQDYFERGDGAQLFGSQQAIVTAMIPKLVVDTRAFAQAVVGERRVDIAVGNVDRWAHAHPARGKHFLRESLVGAWSEAFGSGAAGAFATRGRVDQSVEEIAERLQFINESMLKQVRWNAELVASGLARPEDLEIVRRSMQDSAGLIDHVFARFAQVLGAALLFVGVAGFFAMQWWVSLNRPRPRQPSAGIVHDTWWRHR
jgi:hypothetical protein